MMRYLHLYWWDGLVYEIRDDELWNLNISTEFVSNSAILTKIKGSKVNDNLSVLFYC